MSEIISKFHWNFLTYSKERKCESVSHSVISNSLVVVVSKSCPAVVIPRSAACQAPLSMGFSRREYWSGLPFPSPGDLPNPGIELGSLALQADSLPSEPPGKLIY